MPRILLVDHQIESCGTLANLLRSVGYCVDCAYSGAAAIDHLRSIGTDLTILDIAMPRLAGWQVLQWIRATRETGSLPVIVHTAMSNAMWELAREQGADELWVRGSCSFAAMCDSLEQYFEQAETQAA